jgi:DNA-directed RNA polymerase subunit RPC12/RpoP
MVDILTTAKELLAKGIALNDADLIAMANSILNSEAKTAVATEGVPQQEYKCLNCAHVFSSAKLKKACPKCKKRKLMLVEHKVTAGPPPVVTEKQDYREINGIYHKKGKVPRVNPITGAVEGSYGRTEPIIVKPNSFVDDGTEGEDGRMFDKKYGKFFRRSPRVKPVAKPLNVPCGICHRPFELSPALYRGQDAYYVCNKCGSRSR